MEQKMEDVFSALERQDVPALLAMFHNGEARVDLPSFGMVSNNRIFKMLVGKIAAKFRQLNISARYIGAHGGGNVLVAEYRLSYDFYDEERKKDLPYSIPTALVCDLDGEGRILAATVYTGMEYLVGKEILRPALYNGAPELWKAMSDSVVARYERIKPETLTEPCRVHTLKGCVCVEENVLMTRAAICTPQAHLSVFDLGEDGEVKECREYGEVVWDFKLWPVLY